MRCAHRTVAVLSLVMAIGCGGGDGSGPSDSEPEPAVTGQGTPIGSAATATIGTAGGSLMSDDSRVRLTIPAGALAGNTDISIQRITDLAPGSQRSYRFSPDGIVFAQPVTLLFHYDSVMQIGSAPELLTVATQLANGSWELLPPEDLALETGSSGYNVRMHHFSDYTMLQGVQIRPPSGEIDPGQSIGLEVVNCTRIIQRDGENSSGYVIDCDSGPPPQDGSDDLPPLPTYRIDVSSWAANGVRGGNSTQGFVAGSNGSAQYIAPQNPPAGNPVAVSVKVRDRNGSEVTQLVANIKIRNSCGPATTNRAASLRALECYPDRLDGSSSTTITDATPSYTLAADFAWILSGSETIPGQRVVYKAEGVARFAALNSCISISPTTYDWQDGNPTAGGTLEINLEDSTWTATGTSLWSATYQDTCEEGSSAFPGAAGGGWLAANGHLSPDFRFSGTQSHNGQTFTFTFGPTSPPPQSVRLKAR